MTSPRRSTELHPRALDGAALVKRIANRDESALATLYDATCGLIYGLLLRILGSSEAAERILLDTYQQVWEQAATYDDERETPITWLIAIAHSRAIARLRADSHNRHRQASLTSAGHTLTTRTQTDEKILEGQKSFQSAFAKLSPAQKQIIELAYFSGLPQNEIAARLGLSLQSVQMGMRAGMKRLRDALEFPQLHPV